MAFRPDLNGPRSLEQTIIDLRRLEAELHPDDPRAKKIAEMIRGLCEFVQETRARRDSNWFDELAT